MRYIEPDKEKYEVLLRYRTIELIVYWEGRLNTPRLMELFGVSRQQASKDMRIYTEKYNPNSLVYDMELKAYKPAIGFKTVLSHGHINEYMDLLTGIISQSAPITFVAHPYIASVQFPDRSVNPEVVRALLHASRKKNAITITYASMKNPEPARRDISPDTLIYTGFRWHVRAYCHKRRMYRDFNVSRIFKVLSESKEAFVDNERDDLWHQHIGFSLVPNPLLLEKQQQLVKKDFAMQCGKLKITTRKALVHYTLQRYQVALENDEAADPFKFPLVIDPKSQAIIEPCLFSVD